MAEPNVDGLSKLERFLIDGKRAQPQTKDANGENSDFACVSETHPMLNLLPRADLLSLRLVSKTFNTTIMGRKGDELFGLLRVFTRRSYTLMEQSLCGLREVGAHCRHLVVSFLEEDDEENTTGQVLPDRFFEEEAELTAGPLSKLAGAPRRHRSSTAGSSSSGHPCAQYPDKALENKSDWAAVFRSVSGIKILAFTMSASAYRFDSHIKATMVTIRLALNEAQLPRLTELRLRPIRSEDMAYFHWPEQLPLGLTSFPRSNVLRSITTLEIRLKHDFEQEDKRIHQEFLTLLHDWLRSFEDQILVLKFHWIMTFWGDDWKGPNPLTLEDARFPAIHWRSLETLYLSGVKPDDIDIPLLFSRTPKLQHLYLPNDTLFRILPDAKRADTNNLSMWRDVELPHGPEPAYPKGYLNIKDRATRRRLTLNTARMEDDSDGEWGTLSRQRSMTESGPPSGRIFRMEEEFAKLLNAGRRDENGQD